MVKNFIGKCVSLSIPTFQKFSDGILKAQFQAFWPLALLFQNFKKIMKI